MARKKKILAVLAIIRMQRKRNERKKSVKRECWVKPWTGQRVHQGAFPDLLNELHFEDPEEYRSYLRMDVYAFEELVQLITPHIQRKNTKWRAAIPPDERLAITLRFLATGESYKSLHFKFHLGRSTISEIVPDTCRALYKVLWHDHIKTPDTADEWEKVARLFEERWQFPNCVGAFDGKYVNIKPPSYSGSTYLNCKHSFNIVFMALVDADYKFLHVDVGTNDRISDGGFFASCNLNEHLLDLPLPKELPGSKVKVLYMIVADEVFPVRTCLMKPYLMQNLTLEQKVFNYRLSRARRVAENAFGILTNRFRLFFNPISLSPEKVRDIVLATCALHNFLCTHSSSERMYIPPGTLDSEDPESHDVVQGMWRNGNILPQASMPKNTNYSEDAQQQRDYICQYFSSTDGAVSWQLSKID